MAQSSNTSGSGLHISVNEDAIRLKVKNIESMMTDNPELRTKLREVIREDLWKARNAVVGNMQHIFENGDPMEARRAIRHVVYHHLLGGNLNIMPMQRGTAAWKVQQKQRKVDMNPHMRGGNRIRAKFQTIRMQGYEGKARGMILRWLNQGTKDRTTKYGFRGAIAPRHFFQPMAGAALNVVSQHLAQMIEQEIENVFNNKEE